jgi:NAD(P)-dependent dehydrogenase (short-subunit alcohol dehydrogenase family)
MRAIGRHIPLRRAGLPDEVLNAVVLLASGEASYITGAGLVADGDRSTVLPGSPV